ncbi:leucine zipper-like transcriptional regulator [Cystoisospora suis]|uniref:Leucine zipper-like transcriptional regulator n=1 Tax=Cystoisospora suis TaxID=483139 RepID=A0A2C6LCY5_9APIC|nr:leucine zipper-like transcriptional regulator [Cystoisospora suis]
MEKAGGAADTRAVMQIGMEGALHWTEVTIKGHPSHVLGRIDPVTGVYRDSLYVFGESSSNRRRDMWRFDFCKRRWYKIRTTQPSRRRDSGAIVLSGRMYIFGGRSDTVLLQDLHAFDFLTERWTELETGGGKPSARYGCVCAACSTYGILFVFAGSDSSGALRDMYELDLNTLQWIETDQRGSVPSAREGASSVQHRNFIYLFGGRDGERYFGDFFCFDMPTRLWTSIDTLPLPAPPLMDSDFSSSRHGAADEEKVRPGAHGRVGDYGGEAETSSANGAPSPRYRHGAAAHRHCMYIFGGCNTEGLLNDLYVFNFDTRRWHAVESSNVPSPRMSVGAHIHKNSLYIFGGREAYRCFPDFYEVSVERIPVPPSSFMADLERLVAPPYSDVTFVVEGGKRLHGCKAILMARSEHFRAMFASRTKEENVEVSQQIEIEDLPCEVVAALLQYIHTDEFHERLSWQHVLQLMIAAERFRVSRLKWLCVECVRGMLNVENVVGVLIAAHAHSIVNLKEYCLQFLVRHEDTVKRRDTLRPLIPHSELLVEVLARYTSWRSVDCS